MAEPESLVRIKLEDGTFIEFRRTENNEVHICQKDLCAILPKASGKVTLDLFALLEQFGNIEEEPNEAA